MINQIYTKKINQRTYSYMKVIKDKVENLQKYLFNDKKDNYYTNLNINILIPNIKIKFF